jgi:hypothetical protein
MTTRLEWGGRIFENVNPPRSREALKEYGAPHPRTFPTEVRRHQGYRQVRVSFRIAFYTDPRVFIMGANPGGPVPATDYVVRAGLKAEEVQRAAALDNGPARAGAQGGVVANPENPRR